MQPTQPTQPTQPMPPLRPATHHQPPAAAHDDRPVPQILAQWLLQLFPGPRPRPVLVGGPGGTGKSTFARRLAQALPQAAVLRLDHYKQPRTRRQAANLFGAHPQANAMQLIAGHLRRLRQGRPIAQPVYESAHGAALRTTPFQPRPFILVEGEVATYWHFRDLLDLCIYIDADWRTQLNTRLTRDIEQRGYTPEKAIATFLHSNLREFSQFGAPTKAWADIHLFCRQDYSLQIEAVAAILLPHLGLPPAHPAPSPAR